MLDFETYQNLADNTSGAYDDKQARTVVAALGLAGEAGEYANLVKKFAAHGHDIRREEFVDELGDVLWYVAEAATSLGLRLDDIALANIDKLQKRYGGKFTQEKSINR